MVILQRREKQALSQVKYYKPIVIWVGSERIRARRSHPSRNWSSRLGDDVSLYDLVLGEYSSTVKLDGRFNFAGIDATGASFVHTTYIRINMIKVMIC